MSQEKLMNVLIGPHVSEKSARISEGANQFVFRVRRDATKPDIKAAVELMFEVKVAGRERRERRRQEEALRPAARPAPGFQEGVRASRAGPEHRS